MKARHIWRVVTMVGMGVVALALLLRTSTKDYGNGRCPRCDKYTDLHECRECGKVLCRQCWKYVDSYCPHN